jgi:RNA polymerase sigma factor (TIGR02999 family)
VAECTTREAFSEPASGESLATKELFEALYGELHTIAEHSIRRGGSELTLGPTTLIHEAYLSVAGRDAAAFADKPRFLGYASRAMRGLVIDYARRRNAKKRARGFEITLTGADLAPPEPPGADLDALDEALGQLAAWAPSLAEVVDLHFFGGFTFAEIGEIRGVSERTIQREWRKARLLLHRAMHSESGGPLDAGPAEPGASG